MPDLLQINDAEDHILSFDLIDILEALDGESPGFTWAIHELWAESAEGSLLDLGPGRNVLRFEEELKASPIGVVMDWQQLVALARSARQVIDAIIVATRDIGSLPEWVSVEDLYKTCEIVIEACDSSYWLVYARNDLLINKLETAFKDVKRLSVPSNRPVT